MTSPYKPENYTSVSPYLVVNGARATIDFLKRVFDADELRTFPSDDGRLMYAEVRIDDTVVMLADSAQLEASQPGNPPSFSVSCPHDPIAVQGPLLYPFAPLPGKQEPGDRKSVV